MSKSITSIKISKFDYARVIATETLPFETPIIFSNDGLYRNIKEGVKDEVSQFLMRSLVESTQIVSATVPFKYKIRKSGVDFRRLSLLHPLSQSVVKKFYEKYQTLILHYCTKSLISIRSPRKIASTYYRKSSWQNINKYKSGKVAEDWSDGSTKHSPSYFAYKGYDRLYKFYESRDFYSLEKKFEIFLNLDVAKCFDSIYTHSLAWAVKDKEFTKSHVKVGSTFSEEFDYAMRHCNHNETNGIVIGPEVSRIFSEIIFQEIDRRVIARLEEDSFSLGKDYDLRRYVDDVFIFAHEEEGANQIYKVYADILGTFNLHPNHAKSQLLKRPFYTLKSRVIKEASNKVNNFLSSFLRVENSDHQALIPQKIYNKWSLTKAFVGDIKSLCSQNDVGYDELASFLNSILSERIKKLATVDLSNADDEVLIRYRDAYLVLLDVMYFLYGVAPSVSSSYKLCTSIIISIRFSKLYLKAHSASIKQRLFDLSEQLLLSKNISTEDAIDKFLSLESINIALAMNELGEEYPLSQEAVETVFRLKKECNYFDIVCGLFYIGDNSTHRHLKYKFLAEADKKLSNLSDIETNTEKTYLLLDLVSCPYVPNTYKQKWLHNLYKKFSVPVPAVTVMQAFLDSDEKPYWFINWSEVDLLNALEKKELKRAY